MFAAASLLLLAASMAQAKTHLHETFSSETLDPSWVTSDWKGKENMGEWDVSSGEWNHGDAALARGLRTSQDAKFYAISKRIEEPFTNEGKPLVVQFAVKHEKHGSSFCGGGYIKLLPSTTQQDKFGGDSPYYLMFGPDICGYDVSRVHLIFTSADGENQLRKEDIKLEATEKNEYTHLYTLTISPDNTYSVQIDGKVRADGNLGDGMFAKFPMKEINDPSDVKPADWVEEAKIADPASKKPEDWDESEPKMIKDSASTKPEDWNDEEDGEWEAPVIDNPKYKGKWTAPKIDNPEYKGKWYAKKIANPEYKGDSYVYRDIGVVGFELWVVNGGSVFSNILITDSVEEAKKEADKITSEALAEAEKAAKKAFDGPVVQEGHEEEEEDLDIPEDLAAAEDVELKEEL